MYAVIISGGKQHRVEEGEVLKLEKLEAATGESVEFDQVLMVGEGADVKIGAPVVDGSTVTAEVVSHGRHAKIKIVKFNRRKHQTLMLLILPCPCEIIAKLEGKKNLELFKQ